MNPPRPHARTIVPRWACIAVLSLCFAATVLAQVSPNEILDPRLKILEKQYFLELKTINQQISRTQFPFPFSLNRAVGLDPSQQIEADTRGLEFRYFKDRIILKATGNYNAAYDSSKFTRNERAADAFRNVFIPIFSIITENIPPDAEFDAIGVEIAFHVRDIAKNHDYEGKDILVVVMDRKDAYQFVLQKDDNSRQDILNRSMIYLGGQEYGLSLTDRDPLVIDNQARLRAAKPEAAPVPSASSSAGRLIRSNPSLMPSSALGTLPTDAASGPKIDLSQSKPAATAADVEKLQAQYETQLEALSKAGQVKFGFVDYDPPAFVIVSKQMVLQMTMKNSNRFDSDKTSIYKRAAQTFDLFLAPKMKDILDDIPNDMPIDYYDFSVLNTMSSASGGNRSEAIEFLVPKNLAQKFVNSEVTNQELIDKGQVLVNGVRIALSLQLAE